MQRRRIRDWAISIVGFVGVVCLSTGIPIKKASAQTEIPTTETTETTEQRDDVGGASDVDEANAEGTENSESKSGNSKDPQNEGNNQSRDEGVESNSENGKDNSTGEGDSDDSQAEKTTEQKAPEKSEKKGKLVNREETVSKRLERRSDDEQVGPASWVQAGVNRTGAPGFADIVSMVPREPGTISVSFQAAGTAGYDVIRARDFNQYVSGRLTLLGQFHENFSANLAVGARNNVNSFGRPEAMLAQGDLDLELRGHYEPLAGIVVGGDLGVLVPTGFESAGPEFSATSLRPRVAGSFQIGRLLGMADTIPLTAHVNAAYRWDNTSNLLPGNVEPTRVERFAHGISAYDAIELGIGAEYDLPYVKPFAAWRLNVPVNGPEQACDGFNTLDCPQEVGFSSYPNVVSLGARAEPIERLGIHAGVDIGLTPSQAQGIPVTAPYKVFAGLSWQIDPTPPVQRVERTVVETRRIAPERYHLIGTVTDKETDEPVGRAYIVYPDRDRSPQMTGEANGRFRSYGFEPGTEISMRVSHPDYEAASVTKKIGEEDLEFAVSLEPKPRMATIQGQVTNPDGEPVQDASVKYTGPSSGELSTDAAGQFSTEVKSGEYTVAVSAEGFQTAGQDIESTPNSTVQMEISLREKPDEKLVEVQDEQIDIQQKISFQSGSANIKEASFAILNQVAATLFEHPDIVRVEVQGHTDDVGAKEMNMELSQNRAEAVKQYLMEQGVSAERLEAKGYGPTRPRVPNISPANRRLNRRVEFKILERK